MVWETLLMRPLVSLASLLLLALAVVPPVAATTPPDSCLFDPAFGDGGVVEIPAEPGVAQWFAHRTWAGEDGNIYVVRSPDGIHGAEPRLYRYLPNGAPDGSFGQAGYVTFDIVGDAAVLHIIALAVDGQGRIWMVIAGGDFNMMRLLPDGSVDTSFESPSEPVDRLGTMGGALRAGADGSMSAAFGVGEPEADDQSVLYLVFGSDDSVTGRSFRAEGGAGLVPMGIGPTGWVVGHTLDNDYAPSQPWVWHPDTEAGAVIHEIHGSYLGAELINGGLVAFGGIMIDQTWRPYVAALDHDGRVGKAATAAFASSSLDVAGGDGTPQGVVATVRPGGLFEVVDAAGSDSTHRWAGWVNADVSATLTATRDLSGLDGTSVAVTYLTPTLGAEAVPGVLGDQVARLYLAYFLRPPDDAGWAYWSAVRARGASLAAVSAEFAASPEFTATYGELDNAAFVDRLYENVLGRPGDLAGTEFWLGLLDSGALDRGGLMVEFSESPEYVAKTATLAAHDGPTGQVFRLYDAFFDRPPDADGSCYWVRRMAGGEQLVDIAAHFAVSDEFVATYGSLSDEEFVKLVYRNVLGRDGDEAGVAYWTGLLGSGALSRGEAMVGFSESPEYVLRTGTLPT